jgi:hypothetical protein
VAQYGRIAEGCGHRLEAGTRGHARWCSSACRQAAYRRRINPELRARGDRRDRPRLAVLDGGSALDARLQNRRPSARPDVVPATSPRRPTGDEPTIPPHAHSGRLCAVCMSSRHLEVRVAPRARRSAELLAHEIRKARGDTGRPVELPSHGRDVLERSRVAAARGAEVAELTARTLELARTAAG